MFLNCEAESVYAYKARLEEGGFTVRFNDYHDLMCAARLGKGGRISQIAGPREGPDDTGQRHLSWAIFQVDFGLTVNREGEVESLARGRMKQVRVCIFHVHHKAISE